MKENKAIEQAQKWFPKGSFKNELSRNNWQQEALEAVKCLGQKLQQFNFVTHSQGDSLFVRFAFGADLAQINWELLVRRDEQEEGEPDEENSGCVEIRYWQRYKDLLEEQKRELGTVPKCMKDNWKLLFGPKGRFAFQHNWPILDVCHDTCDCGRISCGPFLNRTTKKRLRRYVTKAILEEIYSKGLIARRGKNGPFLTLEGNEI